MASTHSTPLLGHKSSAPQLPYSYPQQDFASLYAESERRRKRTKHCWIFGLIVAAILLLTHWYKLPRMIRPHRPGGKYEIISGGEEMFEFSHIWPGDSEGDYDCVNGDQWDEAYTTGDRHAVTTAFTLPIDSQALTFLARGAYTHGHVDIVSGEPGDSDVRVEVRAEYRERWALDKVTVCRFHYDKDGRDGVGIFSPRHRHGGHHDSVYVHLVIRLPPHDSLVRQVPPFITAMPLFSQTMEDLTEAFEFGTVTLGATNQKLLVKDIHVTKMIAHTTNAAITGSFNTSDTLKLATTNGPIKVDVTAFNHDNTNDVILHTTNGLLAANLSLVKSAASGSASHFKVVTATTNNQLRVNYLTSPADSVLEATATTTNSPAYVRLHSAYEGSFLASTTHTTPVLERVTEVEDPSGRGRERKVNVDMQIRGMVAGTASWQPSEHDKGKPGKCTVHTTNSALYLTV